MLDGRNTRQQPQVDLSDLQQAKRQTPEQEFLKEANQLFVDRIQEVTARIAAEMRADDYKAVKNFAQHSSAALTEAEKREYVLNAAQQRAAQELATQKPIFADFTEALKRHGVAIATPGSSDGLIPKEVERLFGDRLANSVHQAITTAISTAYSEVLTIESQAEGRRQKQEKEKVALTKEGRETRATYFSNNIDSKKFDLTDWIDNSGLRNPHEHSAVEKRTFVEDLKKIQRLGIWLDPKLAEYATKQEQAEFKEAQVSPSFFKTHRAVSALCWAGTIGGLALATVTVGPASLIGWAPLLGAINLGFQKGIQFRHDRQFDVMFKEISRELKNAGPMESSIAWAGVMHKFLTDYKPTWFNNNSTEFWQNAESMSLEAARRQLRQAAAYGAGSIVRNKPEEPKETFFKDTKFNDYISQNDDAMKSIEKRWKHYTDLSKSAAKFGAGVGLMALFA
jgi:hypothetical protein